MIASILPSPITQWWNWDDRAYNEALTPAPQDWDAEPIYADCLSCRLANDEQDDEYSILADTDNFVAVSDR